MDFDKIMAEVNAKQLEQFKSLLKDKMNRKYYLSVYLGSFLGDQYFPMTEENFDLVKTMDDVKFNGYCHKTIDSISLCEEEIDFFHAMVDISDKENYIERCLELYQNTKNLEKCQLGENILKCLEESKHVKIY